MSVFLVPSKIVSGVDSVKELGDHIKGKGTKALIVTDKFMIQFGNVKKVTDVLDTNNIEYEVFSDVTGEPTDLMVMSGVNKYVENNCDFLIGLGGGSPLDTAKAIGLMASDTTKKISDYMGETINLPVPYLVAIPTTAGTGSEVTQFTIITDTENNVKMLLAGPSILPNLAIVDPAFTMTAPPSVTAATGVDALCHAVEAYTSRKAQPLSDVFALSAIKRIYKNLPLCYSDGKNMEARMEMALGATEAGIAFNNSSVTIVHGMSRPIGALFHIAHGVSNAILLPSCMEFAIDGNLKRFADIAKVMEIVDEKVPDEEAAKVFVKEISVLCKNLGIPSISELGVSKEEFYNSLDKMATDALISGSPSNTMREPSKEDIIEIYKKLF